MDDMVIETGGPTLENRPVENRLVENRPVENRLVPITRSRRGMCR
jgi:hypothetical protein